MKVAHRIDDDIDAVSRSTLRQQCAADDATAPLLGGAEIRLSRMTLWFLRSRSNKYAVRVDIAAAAADLRGRMRAVREISSPTGSVDWESAREIAGKCDSQFVAAARTLPFLERRLALAWERSLVMSYWYARGNRHGFELLEERGFALMSMLPEGVQASVCREFVDAVDHRHEMGSRVDGVGESVSAAEPALVEVTQKALRRRMKDERQLIVLESVIGGQSGRIGQSLRHYVPWLDFACEYLEDPREVQELEMLVARWRIERSKYVVENPDYAHVRIVDVKTAQGGPHHREGM